MPDKLISDKKVDTIMPDKQYINYEMKTLSKAKFFL